MHLQMNTRLQVEHPITEAITGLDLVEQMIRVAAGQALDINQEEIIKPKGWAMECRVYAEDPARGFLPSTGRLKRYVEPAGHNVRVDSGVEEGSNISVHYDPMISKMVTYGTDRGAALALSRRALDEYVIRGVQHNAPLLRSVLDAPDFVAGTFSTAFLAEHFPHPESSAPAHLPLTAAKEQEVLALAAALHAWRELRLGGTLLTEQLVLGTASGDAVTVAVRPSPAGMVPPRSSPAVEPALEIELPERVLHVSLRVHATPTPVVYADIDGAEAICQVIHRQGQQLTLQYAGAHRTFTVASPTVAALQPLMPPPHVEDLSRLVRSPMPGTLVVLKVAVGDEVEAGEEVAVVEAMKMRNSLRSGAAGRVKEVGAAQGASVAADQVIVRLE
jgi:propionyl-CoA carboxylase alpha chain